MSFREVLSRIVVEAPGGIGAVLVDEEGEAIDLFTRGDSFETKLAGAHHGIVLAHLERALLGAGGDDSLGAVCIRSERYIFTLVPVQEGISVVLIQDKDGSPSRGLRILRESLPALSGLI